MYIYKYIYLWKIWRSGLAPRGFQVCPKPPATLASRSDPASGSCQAPATPLQAPWPPLAKPPALSGPLPGNLRGFLRHFGRPQDVPGHQKPMIFMILSLKITVARISKKSTFGRTFGPVAEHFGHHFGGLCEPWGPFGVVWAAKAARNLSKSRKKTGKMRSRISVGARRGQRDAKGAPGPTKSTPKAREIHHNMPKNRHPPIDFVREARAHRSPSRATLTRPETIGG